VDGNAAVDVAVVVGEEEAVVQWAEPFGDVEVLELDGGHLDVMGFRQVIENETRLRFHPAEKGVVALGDEQNLHGKDRG
jgi:hypothetical protein